MIPVLSYYQLLHSRPSLGADELERDVSNLRNRATMRAYWADYSLLLRRVAPAAGRHLVVIQIEPDLWGFLEKAHATALARSFARHLIALRNRLAPHVLLAWHLSVWGTARTRPTPSRHSRTWMNWPPPRRRSTSRCDAHFDLVFNDVTNRDAGFYRTVQHNPNTAWGPEDFRRHDAYIAGFTRRTHTPVVLWQLPLGNTTLDDTLRPLQRQPPAVVVR